MPRKPRNKSTPASFKNLAAHLVRQMKTESVRSRRLLDELTELVFEKSQQTVPVDTGALKSSGRIVKQQNVRVGDAKVFMANTIEYGGKSGIGPTKNAPDGIVFYAAFVHDLHKPFLMEAINQAQPEMNRRIRRRANRIKTTIVKTIGD